MFVQIQYKLVRSRGHQGSHWKTADENIPPHVTSYEVTGLQTERVYRWVANGCGGVWWRKSKKKRGEDVPAKGKQKIG